MKFILCAYEKCGSLHRHHEWDDDHPDPPRYKIEVTDDVPDDKEIFCSISCACYAGRFSVTKGWIQK